MPRRQSLLNTAEGNGRRALKQRARFSDDARGSAMESAACLDALAAKRACGKDRIAEGKDILLSIVSMLTKLVERFGGGLQEEEGGGRAGAGLAAARRNLVSRR